MRRAVLLGSVLLAASAACGSPGPIPIPVTETRWDALDPTVGEEFARARALHVSGDFAAARAAFERMSQRDPENILLGTWLEEAELGAALLDVRDPTRRVEVEREVARVFAHRAEVSPTLANLFLAARLESDPARAAALLDAAEALDPTCAWVPYARAHLAARESDWPRARQALDRAKALDPGHVWAFGLEAWVLTRTGTVEEGANALEAWLDRTRDDPRVDPSLVASAELDLALLRVLQGEPDDARDLLRGLDARRVDDGRRFSALACVAEAEGDVDAALAAAQSAMLAHPFAINPALQVALLYDDHLRDPVRAEAAWKHVLELAQSSSELLSALQRTRARVRLERFEAARAARAESGGKQP